MSTSTTQSVVRKQLCAMGCELFEIGVLRHGRPDVAPKRQVNYADRTAIGGAQDHRTESLIALVRCGGPGVETWPPGERMPAVPASLLLMRCAVAPRPNAPFPRRRGENNGAKRQRTQIGVASPISRPARRGLYGSQWRKGAENFHRRSALLKTKGQSSAQAFARASHFHPQPGLPQKLRDSPVGMDTS